MRAEAHLVELCDLKNGRITFTKATGASAATLKQYRVSVTDKNDHIHPVEAHTQDRTIAFDYKHEWLPLRRVRVTDQTGKEVFAAESLFPATNKEFQNQFKSARDRSGDARINHFTATQIFEYFTGEDGYRISAAVVAAYKAMELLDEDLLHVAENMLVRSLSLLPSVKMARSARNNREHLHVSVLCTLYHVHLARGRPQDFLRTLLALEKLLKEAELKSYFNLAYNASLSLRLLTVLFRRAGMDSEARRISQLAFNVFKLSVQDAGQNMTHFKELGYVHSHTYEAMRVSRHFKSVSQAFAEKTVRSCLRVSASDYPETFQRMLSTFSDAAEHLGTNAGEATDR